MTRPHDISQAIWDEAIPSWGKVSLAEGNALIDICKGEEMADTLNTDALNTACSIEADIPSRITGANRVFIRAVIARALSDAYARGLEDAANFVEGKGGVIPGAALFAPLVSHNNMPDMSGDPRARLSDSDRRDFDDATEALASEIRALANK